MRIAYIAHDVGDPKVQQRCRELVRLGHEVTVLAFDRGKTLAEAARLPCPTIDLGRTQDYAYLQRAWSVVSGTLRVLQHRHVLAAADVIFARNLEPAIIMLVATIALRARAKLIYESLDLHRFLVGDGAGSSAMRWLERQVLRRVDRLVVSSPWFVEAFYQPQQGFAGKWFLLENKMTAADLEAATGSPRPQPRSGRRRPGPWRIGWFGMLRCMRSLQLLGELASRSTVAVEVSIRGRPTEVSNEDFARLIARLPNVTYGGPYRNPTDLRSLYENVDLVWCPDFYDAGKNSQWLLPNRLYEALCLGKPLIALAGTATGHYVELHGVGWTVTEPVDTDLERLIATLRDDGYDEAVRRIASLPPQRCVDEGELGELLDGLSVAEWHQVGSTSGDRRAVLVGPRAAIDAGSAGATTGRNYAACDT